MATPHQLTVELIVCQNNHVNTKLVDKALKEEVLSQALCWPWQMAQIGQV